MTSNVVAVDNDQKLSKYAIYALAFGLIGNALDFMDWQFLANVAPVITKEFGFSSNTMALLLGAPFIGVGVGGMFGGWVSDRIGRVKTMALCMAWFSIFTVIFPSCNGFTSMFIFRILAGIGLGALWGVGNTLAAEWLPPKHRMLGGALIQVGSSVGLIGGAYLTSFIVPVHGWRPLFYTGGIGFLFAILALVMLKEPAVWLEAKKKQELGQAKLGDLRIVFQQPYLNRAIAGFFLVTLVLWGYWGASSWLPTWLATEKGLSVAKSMSYLYMVGLGAIVAYMVIGLNAWKWGRKAPAYIGLALGVPAVLIFASLKSNTALLYFTPVYAAFTVGVSALFGGLLSELFPTQVRGALVTGIYSFGRLTTFAAPFLLSVLAGATSMSFAIGCTAALFLLAIIPLKLLPETKHLNEF